MFITNFEINEKIKIYLLKNHLNINTTEMNRDNQSYLSQRYENHPRFINISSIRETIQEVM